MQSFDNGNLVLLPPEESERLERAAKGGREVIKAVSSPLDYYTLTPLRFRVGSAPERPCYVEVTFYDDFLAQIMCEGEGAAGFTGCMTNRFRRAVFKLTPEDLIKSGGVIEVKGCEALADIRLTEDEACVALAKSERAKKEELTPIVSLRREMQLVTTCNIASFTGTDVEKTLNFMDDFCPLMRKLGFNGFEGYVHWRLVEPERGKFDFSYYDALLDKAAEYDLKWFPLLIVGSAYALPEWFHDNVGYVRFKCLEHGLTNEIPTIFNRDMDGYVKTFLKKFGEHYEPTGRLLGVRLGPSGNYGESQYPASGQNGYLNQPHHIHLGWWAGDECAPVFFREWLKKKYADIGLLSEAWGKSYGSFDEIETFLPVTAVSFRMRKDFVDWYNFEMTDWCEKWALWAREGMPDTVVYQSIGGWGFDEAGTDFTLQPKSMRLIGNSGARSTNENDGYLLNNNITRMISSAARFYGVAYGSEPAGFGCGRGVAARFYNILIRAGEHLFYYSPNLVNFNESIKIWLRQMPLLDERDVPFVEVAAYYPQTRSRLDDGTVRYIQASSFFTAATALRPYLDFDFCSDEMINDGALESYKVIVFLTRGYDEPDVIEKETLEHIDAWVRAGGYAIYPISATRRLSTVEGDGEIYDRWKKKDTGRGKVVFFRSDGEPPVLYSRFIRDTLKKADFLDKRTHRMLNIEKPETVFAACFENGRIPLMNFDENAAFAVVGDSRVALDPFEILIV